MAFRKSYTKPDQSRPTSFAGKYGLNKVAGLDNPGKEAYVIPLDMQNGYVSIPTHTVKKNDLEGFKGSSFDQVEIVCHRYDPNTGEPSTELPLCCRLAQAEKDRMPEKEDSVYRALSFTGWKSVIPVLVLGTTEDDASKKPTLKKLSLNGIGFSFIKIADSSYKKEIQAKVIEDLETNGIIEDKDGMNEEELLGIVQNHLQHSVLRIINNKSEKKGIKYVRTYKAVPTKNKLVGELSGEGAQIRALCRLLAGEVDPAEFDAFYAKYPLLQEINNQVNDYLTLFSDNVDSLVTEWEDSELETYYNKFLGKQEQINKFKSEPQDDEEEVEFVDEDEEETTMTARVVSKPVGQTRPVQIAKPVARQVASAPQRTATTTATVAKPAVAVMEVDEEEYVDNNSYSISDLEDSPILNDVEFVEDEFMESDFIIDDEDSEFEDEE